MLSNEVLTVTDVSDALVIGRNRVYELLRSGELKGFRVGKSSWRIPRECLEEYIIQKCKSEYRVRD